MIWYKSIEINRTIFPSLNSNSQSEYVFSKPHFSPAHLLKSLPQNLYPTLTPSSKVRALVVLFQLLTADRQQNKTEYLKQVIKEKYSDSYFYQNFIGIIDYFEITSQNSLYFKSF